MHISIKIDMKVLSNRQTPLFMRVFTSLVYIYFFLVFSESQS